MRKTKTATGYNLTATNGVETALVGGLVGAGCLLVLAVWVIKIILIVLLIVLALDFVGVIDPFDL